VIKSTGCELSGLPTMIGSMPHTDPQRACSIISKFLPEIPVWPQLPKRSFLENMYAQYSEGFPGIAIEGERIYVDRTKDLDGPLQELYTAYLGNDVEKYSISSEYAAGLYSFLDMELGSARAVKGQLTGPVTWGLTVTDQDRRPILYDETLADAIAKHLHLKAAWQESVLSPRAPDTIIFVDEPYMSSVGSAFVSVSRDQVIGLLSEVFAGINGLKGVHCCGNTDWSMLLATPLDILNFDAYNYGYTISLYPEEVKSFLERGGVIAWGIVPREEGDLKGEVVKGIIDRLEAGMSALERKGASPEKLKRQCLLTPACGLEPASEEAAEWALELLADVSKEYRRRYIKEG
jgi:methionine synthase II (cobalamin-independent)